MKTAFLRRSRWFLLLALLSACSTGTKRVSHQVVAFDFDWDDNIVYMPTKNYVYDRVTGKERGVSTADFAEVRHRVHGPNDEAPAVAATGESTLWRGVDWGKYKLRADDRTG